MSDDSEQTQRLMQEVGVKAARILRKTGRTVSQDPKTGEWTVAPLTRIDQVIDWPGQYPELANQKTINVWGQEKTPTVADVKPTSTPPRISENTATGETSNRSVNTGKSSNKSATAGKSSNRSATTGKLSNKSAASKALRAGRDPKKSSLVSRLRKTGQSNSAAQRDTDASTEQPRAPR